MNKRFIIIIVLVITLGAAFYIFMEANNKECPDGRAKTYVGGEGWTCPTGSSNIVPL